MGLKVKVKVKVKVIVEYNEKKHPTALDCDGHCCVFGSAGL